ncbi:MAG: hypothetical protein GF310_02475 [candidate division Zixibacteria bacterium]|nr:hypothetical protein [candidate division Zixibacteria bacterium]
MFRRYKSFIRGVSLNKIGLAGVVLTTSSFVTFVILELVRILGFITNAYVGLVNYMVFPAIFIIGLILIPIGWRRRKKQTGKSTKELLQEQFEKEETEGKFLGSRIFRTIAIFTIVNVAFLSVLSSRMLHFMDEPHFCGTACHTVMNPEWVTYQASPHARVKCVECHVGEGVDALVDAKLNGLWQIISLTFSLYEQPIPTPVHQLRPARETCEKCHWPDKFYGQRLKTIVNYKKDSLSTPEFTTLSLKIDVGERDVRRGIHWHIAEENEIRYASVDDEREEMIWVDVRQPDGSFKRYQNIELVKEHEDEFESVRVLDCVDCHNRATHIYEQPEKALNERIRKGLINRSIPFIKNVGLGAILPIYNDTAQAREEIANHVRGFYQRRYPEILRQNFAEIDSAIAVLQSIYARNIHPYMKIRWNSYPSHIGHRGDGGCFRCHNPNLVDAEGVGISDDCTLCHSIAAYDGNDPYEYLEPVDTSSQDYIIHQYLKNEFLKSANK